MDVTPQIEQHLTANAKIKRKDIIINNFLGGLAWGFGTIAGASFVVGIIVYVLRIIGVFSFLEPFINQTPIR